jgi:hypothetical protein
LTTREAAAVLGMTPGGVVYSLRRHGIKKTGRDYILSLEDLAKVQSTRCKVGRPKAPIQ